MTRSCKPFFIIFFFWFQYLFPINLSCWLCSSPRSCVHFCIFILFA
uniref:Uncharacterized protein n=1 Tax=Rhizophora mucronata TaxID=61149 RepID=A0A2P2NCM5_RHIMU